MEAGRRTVGCQLAGPVHHRPVIEERKLLGLASHGASRHWYSGGGKQQQAAAGTGKHGPPVARQPADPFLPK